MSNLRKDSEFLKLTSTQVYDQQQAESKHTIKPFLIMLVGELKTHNLMANLPRTELNINQLFTIISQYHRKKLFSANDITYFLENLYPEVPVEDYFSFESDYLTDTTLELFLNQFYDRIFITKLSINNSSIPFKISELPNLDYQTYDKLSLQDKTIVLERLYIYTTYLQYKSNLEDFAYFTMLKLKFDNLVNELIPSYINKADQLYELIKTGYISNEPELEIFNTDGQFNKLYIQIRSNLLGQNKLTKDNFKTIFTSDTSPVLDQIRIIFNSLRTDDPTEFNKFITTVPVELHKRQFYKDVFTNWMLHCMNQWFSSTGAVNKYILILQGEQNCGKDNFIKNNFLSPFSELVAENFTFNTDNKDQLIMLASKLFALDSEMVCTTKQDITQIKKITGQNTIDYRTPFATKSMKYKRNINFIGLTNNTELYRDESLSGGVRFIIIELNERFKFKKAYDEKHIETNDTKPVESISWDRVWGYVYNMYLTDPDIIQKTQYIHKEMVEISENNRIKNPAEEAFITYVHPCNVKYALTAREIKDQIIILNPGLSKIIENTSNKMIAKYLKNIGVSSYDKSHKNYYLCIIKAPLSTENNLNPDFKEPFSPAPDEIDWIFNSKKAVNTLENIHTDLKISKK